MYFAINQYFFWFELQFYRDFFAVLNQVNPVAAVGSVTTIFVLILIKEGINNNPTCMKNLPVPIPVELFVVSIPNHSQ